MLKCQAGWTVCDGFFFKSGRCPVQNNTSLGFEWAAGQITTNPTHEPGEHSRTRAANVGGAESPWELHKGPATSCLKPEESRQSSIFQTPLTGGRNKGRTAGVPPGLYLPHLGQSELENLHSLFSAAPTLPPLLLKFLQPLWLLLLAWKRDRHRAVKGLMSPGKVNKGWAINGSSCV